MPQWRTIRSYDILNRLEAMNLCNDACIEHVRGRTLTGAPIKWCQQAWSSTHWTQAPNKPRADYQILPSPQPRAKHTALTTYYICNIYQGKRNRNLHLRTSFFELAFWGFMTLELGCPLGKEICGTWSAHAAIYNSDFRAPPWHPNSFLSVSL